MRALPVFAAALALAGCGGEHQPAIDLSGTQWRVVECAPYARSLTGMALNGEAFAWWDEARGRYPMSSAPTIGAVLVFRRSGLLPHGHVAVVARLVSARDILVDQANWVHNRISENDEVRDVSVDNDWTLVRVWWRPAMSLGTNLYPAYGFVEPAAVAANRRLQPAAGNAICASSLTAMANPRTG